MRARRLSWLLGVTVFASCGGTPGEGAKGPWPKPRTETAAAVPEPEGFVFRLSEGAPPARERAKVSTGDRLDDKATAAVLGRLPAMTKEADGEKAFALREASKPPPRPGKTVSTPFPPAKSAPAPEAPATGPLKVLRVAPTGEVALAPSLTVTFSQPMVPITTVGDLERSAVPVKLSPEPNGKWRWLGTKTLTFEASPRLPMATEFSIEVPAGTRSASGGALAEAYAGKFATPPPRVVRARPTAGPTRPDTVMVAEFDQRIDPKTVLSTIRVTAAKKAVEIRTVSAGELRSAPGMSDVLDELPEGRWVAFRAVKAMPNASLVSVTVGPGTPSAEGPRKTAKPYSWSFKTYGALRLTTDHCGPPGHCRPGMPFQIEFTNPISARRFDKGMVRVSPEIPGMKVEVWGSSLGITGRTKANTDYEVAVAPTLEDEFGQALGPAREVRFEVGDATPSLSSSGSGGMMVLDPAAAARFSVFSVDHDALAVRAWSVGPGDWEAFGRWLQRDRRKNIAPPGRLAISTTVDVAGSGDEMVETRIDLRPALRGGIGHVVLSVLPDGVSPSDERSQAIETWVQSTRIGLDAFVDAGELVGWATALADGKPLAGVELSLLPGGARAVTGADGVARIGLSTTGAGMLVARKGDDSALLSENPWGGPLTGSWQKQGARDEVRFYVFDDRGIYRPGEEVKFKGWLRRIGHGEGGDVAPIGDLASGVRWTLRDARNNELGSGSARLSVLGGFDGSIKLPKTPNLGHATLQLTTTGAGSFQHMHALQIQEFRRPEFEVTTSAPAGPHFLGSHVDVSAGASYYAGGGLPDAEMEWTVRATPGHFAPPNRDDFTFGRWVPWWDMQPVFFPGGPPGFHRGVPMPPGGEETKSKTFKARTDGGGKHHLRIDLVSARPPRPTTVTAEATVQDKNRQAWSSQTSILVHPAETYVGLRAQRTFVQQGDALVIDAIATDLDGKAVAGRPIAMTSVRIEHEVVGGVPVERELDPESCNTQSTADVVKCTFRPKEPGTWRVTAVVTDGAGRKNETEMTVWVAGEKTQPSRELAQERVTLVPGKKSYRRGDVAEVLVMAPFSPAEGLMTLRRGGIVKTERFSITRGSHTLRVPIEDAYVPGVEVNVDLVGATTRTDDAGEPAPALPKRPAFASGTMRLNVPPIERTLTLTATPREAALEPGAQTVVDVALKDAAGKPVPGAEVAVVVVDEAVLSLSGYTLANPLDVFYAARGSEVRDHHSRHSVVLARPADMIPPATTQAGVPGAELGQQAMAPPPPAPPPEPMAQFKSPMADATTAPGQPPKPIRLRTDFNALATFAPAVPTNASGRAEVVVKVPDNLTRYRVMAVAVAGEKAFGSGESAIVARLPLMVRPSPPRFLNFGDRFELSVLLQNQTAQPLDVDVAVRADNMALVSGAGRRVKVAAGDRVEVRFPAAARLAGTARFQVGAASGKWADAAEGRFPVWTPATTEAFATYGELDQGAIAQAVAAPSDVIADYGGLEITTSSTAVSALSDAVLYLSRYPFECSEQLSSRVLAIAALRDVLTAFRAEGLPPAAALEASVKKDLDRLATLQNTDGGFGFWRRGDDSWPFVSVHVAHALARAKEKRFDVPATLLEASKRYLRAIESKFPRDYPEAERRTILAYALYTRAKLGDRDVARARKLVTESGDKLPVESAGFLLTVLTGASGAGGELASLRKMLSSRVTETAGAAHFATSYSDGARLLLISERRADAVVLEGLIADQPQSDLVPKLVQGLLAHRTAGRWSSTQENAFVLLALDRYFQTYEKATPDFVARAWLGSKFAGEQKFKGRTTERRHVEVPMQELTQGPAGKELILAKDGAGRLYYRIGLRYAPKSLTLPPASHGFTVERAYAAVDNPNDVRRDADGTWRIRSGARVKIRLSMLAPTRRYHVALVDPLPAGLEPLNPALAVTGSVPEGADATPRWWGAWYQHQNLRDERAEAFTTLLWEGLHSYEYFARATTPGTFVVPPPKAEEMYHPETFGRGAGDKVVVE